MIKAVIIDVDDTLCLTEAACFDLENEVLRQMGRPPMLRAVHIATWGRPLFDAMLERSPGTDMKQFTLLYHPVIEEFVTNGRLDKIPDANYQALDQLLAQGKKLMLLTSRTHAEFKHLLAPDHGLAKRITAFYYQDNMQFHKPDPRAFNELLQDNGVQAGECIYVGDSLSDAKAANEAGLRFIASLESGLRQKADFADFRVDAFIATLPEIVQTMAMFE